jgi:NitT/TauT family transport system substrate-binding protein
MARFTGRTLQFVAVLTTCMMACALPRPASADDTLNVIGASFSSAFFEVLDHVAVRAGFFNEEHLNVQKTYIFAASSAAQLVATGKADVVSCSFEPVLVGYEKGLRLQYFFQSDPEYVYALAVLQDSPIKALGDFKGKDIGEISAGSGAEVGTRSMLSGAGLNRNDYSFVAIGSGAPALTALAQNKVAGAAVSLVELSVETVVGGAKFRIFRHPILKNIGTYGFAATPATIRNKGDQLKRYARALVKAALLTRVNPQLAARYFLLDSGQKVTPEALQNEVQILTLSQDDLAAADPENQKIGAFSLRDTEVYARFFADNGLTSQPVPAAAIVTNEFIDYANDFDHKAFIARVKRMQ